MICVTSFCFGQDLIYKRDKTVLTVRIVEIGAESVLYKNFNNQEGPILKIAKSEIIKIKTEAGKVIQIEPLSSEEYFNRNMLKTDIFSLASSKLSICYERNLTPTKNMEVQIGYIGIGALPEEVSELDGGFLRVGLKFKRAPEYFLNRGKNANNFKGGYFKPEFVFGGFSEQRKIYSWYTTYWYDPYVYLNRSVVFGALIGNLGYQWTIGDNVAFDYYLGLGLGFSSKDDSIHEGQNYAVFAVDNIYMQTGLKFGLMF